MWALTLPMNYRNGLTNLGRFLGTSTTNAGAKISKEEQNIIATGAER